MATDFDLSVLFQHLVDFLAGEQFFIGHCLAAVHFLFLFRAFGDDVRAGDHFNDIEFFGADFSYLNGKPYAKGTYLDNLYAIKSSRITNTETAFTKLLYRTELINIEKNKYTTKILESYNFIFASTQATLQKQNSKTHNEKFYP